MRTYVSRKFAILCFAVAIFASSSVAQTWKAGANVTATLSGGTLRIKGTGPMENWNNGYGDIDGAMTSVPPWTSKGPITNVVIENGVTSIGSQAFWGCTGLTSIIIPNSVTSIGYGAFWGCTGLTSITIPNSVTSIGYWAFWGCTGLTSVTIGNSVKSIEGNAFYDCTGLTSVTIGNSVTSIGDGAFSGCTGLTSVTIGNSVKSIEGNAFYDCTNLTSIDVATDNANYSSKDGVLFNKNKTTLIQYPYGKQDAYSIPNSVMSIGQMAFRGCTGLTSVTIPNSVTSIGGQAFDGCTGLTSLTIPNSVTSIGGQAFDGCTGLVSVIIGNGVTSIGSNAFYNCRNLKAIFISNHVPPKDVIRDIHNARIYVPQSSIAAYRSADGWKYLKNLYSGTGLEMLKVSKGTLSPVFNPDSMNYTLAVPPHDSTITITAKPVYAEATVTNTGMKALKVGSNIFKIDVAAFNTTGTYTITVNRVTGSAVVETSDCGPYNDRSAVTATLLGNGTLTVRGKGKMGNLSISHKSSITNVVIEDGVTSIGSSAFAGCTGLTSITIPNSVTSIGQMAFYFCIGLKSITIPNSVTSIGGQAFQGCTGLTSITIPNGVTSIGQSAFQGLTGLTTITIPNSVTSIGQMAFYGCSGLTSVTIPNSVTSIGQMAFGGCTGLTSVEVGIGNTNYSSENGVLFDKDKTVLIEYLLKSKQGAYTIPNRVTSVGPSAFAGCTGLTSITIPNSVTSIGQMAFYGCTGLTSITITNSATSIGVQAFGSCTGLRTITIGNVVTRDKDISGLLDRINTEAQQAAIQAQRAAIQTQQAEQLKAIQAQQATQQVVIQAQQTAQLETMLARQAAQLEAIQARREATFQAQLAALPVAQQAALRAKMYGPWDCGKTSRTLTATLSGGVLRISGKGAMTDHPPWTNTISHNSITSVVIENGVTSIGQMAFGGLYWLTSVTIPNSVTSIGSSAFGGLYRLTSITIPNSVTSIGPSAFAGCTGLTSVISLNPIPQTLEQSTQFAFYGINMTNACLYVQSGSIDKYRSAAGWNMFTCIKDVASR